jgi:LCP family protein required for cell wall assembly
MRRKLLIGSGLIALALLAWAWFGPLHAWRSIERVSFDPTGAREVLADIRSAPRPGTVPTAIIDFEPIDESASTLPTSPIETTPPPQPVPSTPSTLVEANAGPSPDDLDVFLILGSDEKPNDPNPGDRADTILLLVVPDDRSASLLVSIPRALYVTSPCTGELAPINTNLDGCGDVSGLDAMGVAVEDYTGLEIDHLVMFGFDGFTSIVDRIGGLEVCVDNPIKLNARQKTFLEPGCSTLDGSRALRWVRSRQTLEQIDGEWGLMDGAGDAARTDRQRDLVRQVMARANEFDSPSALLSILSELSDSFVLDDDLDLGEAVDLAWDLRTLGRKPILDRSVPATGGVSPDGEFILTPDKPFAVLLTEFEG